LFNFELRQLYIGISLHVVIHTISLPGSSSRLYWRQLVHHTSTNLFASGRFIDQSPICIAQSAPGVLHRCQFTELQYSDVVQNPTNTLYIQTQPLSARTLPCSSLPRPSKSSSSQLWYRSLCPLLLFRFLVPEKVLGSINYSCPHPSCLMVVCFSNSRFGLRSPTQA
jgi:hypothetical protein